MEQAFIVITGVCGGLGQELAKLYFQENIHVVGIDIDQEKLEELSISNSTKFTPLVCDLSNAEDRLNLFENIFSQYGIPEIWFNNAGLLSSKSFEKENYVYFKKVIEINQNAVIDACSFWIPKMKEIKRGTVVNIASIAGHMPAPFVIGYNTSKAAVVNFTRSLQFEHELYNNPVKIILVSPGFFQSSLLKMNGKSVIPEKLNFILSTPRQCADEIYEGVKKGRHHIVPVFTGKISLLYYYIFPWLYLFQVRLLMKGLWKFILIKKYGEHK